MKFIKQQKGQIGILQLLGIGSGILVAVISGYFTQSGRTDAKLENFKAKVAEERVVYTADISSIKTSIGNINSTLERIERKIK